MGKPQTAAPFGCHGNHLNDRPVAAYAALKKASIWFPVISDYFTMM